MALGDASMGSEVRQRWGTLLADTAGLAGGLALDADRKGEARAYFGLARDVAGHAKDGTLQALAVAGIGLLHSPQYGGNATASAWYMSRAATQLPAKAPDYIRAWLHGQAAKEAAAAGRESEFSAGMDLAQQALQRGAVDRQLGGFWSDSAYFSSVGQPGWAERFAGRGLAYLGRDEGGETLTRSLDAASDPRDVAAVAHGLAEWYLGRDEPEQAAITARRALGVVPKWTARVRVLRTRMDPWADLSAVRDLDEALAATA